MLLEVEGISRLVNSALAVLVSSGREEIEFWRDGVPFLLVALAAADKGRTTSAR